MIGVAPSLAGWVVTRVLLRAFALADAGHVPDAAGREDWCELAASVLVAGGSASPEFLERLVADWTPAGG